jgi:hypothetical protein
MTARRRLLAAGSATFALAALTACEKPAPIVTLVSAGESVYSEAAAFCFDEERTLEEGCPERATDVVELSTRPGEVVGVDVAKEVADRGWELTLIDPTGQVQTQRTGQLESDHYFSFTAPNLSPAGYDVRVQTVEPALDENGEPRLDEQGLPVSTPTGEWRFRLVPRS